MIEFTVYRIPSYSAWDILLWFSIGTVLLVPAGLMAGYYCRKHRGSPE